MLCLNCKPTISTKYIKVSSSVAFEVSLNIDALTDDAVYNSLDTSRSEIPLLEILRLKTGQPVECCLHTVSLDDSPTFVALSHVWGDPCITSNI